MEHVVFFPAADGSPAFRRLPSLQEAVDFVEHLRNEQEVRDVSVHSLAEVPLNFRTVYRVEVAGAVPAPSEPVEPLAAEAVVEPVEAPAPDASADESVAEAVADVPAQDTEAVAAGADGHSLGFFAG
jgi:hypothetical protein